MIVTSIIAAVAILMAAHYRHEYYRMCVIADYWGHQAWQDSQIQHAWLRQELEHELRERQISDSIPMTF